MESRSFLPKNKNEGHKPVLKCGVELITYVTHGSAKHQFSRLPSSVLQNLFLDNFNRALLDSG